MENASKALLMAAGILIGMIILSLFTYEMLYVSNNARAYDEATYTVQVTQFNAQFEIYENKEKITAQEVITLYNYVQEWNRNNINTYITLSAETTNSLELKRLISGNLTIEQFLDNCYNKTYTCKLKYDDNNIAARVNEIIIKENIFL